MVIRVFRAGVRQQPTRILMVSTFTSLALGATALAADLPPLKRAAPVPVMGPWAGVYLGGFVGGQWSKDRWTSDETDPAETLGAINLKANGFTGGVISGANLQFGNAVWGVETDLGALTGSNTFNARIPPGFTDIDSIQTKLRYNAHARLRFGWSMGSWMPFVAAGGAYANTKSTLTDSTNTTRPVLASVTQDRVGYTIGAGVDWMFAPNWLARVEFLHDRYLTGAFALPVQDDSQYLELNTNTVRAALLYNFNANSPDFMAGIIRTPAAQAKANWAGVYVGAFAGGHWSKDRWSSDETRPADRFGPLDIKVNGGSFGGLIGANVQYGNFVWGVEADIGGLTGTKTFAARFPPTATDIDSIETRLRWNAHARIRSGYSFGSWMPFLTTGIAYANTRMTVANSTNIAPQPTTASISLDRVGFSAGFGVDWMFAPNWIARAEYINDRYTTASFQVPSQVDTQHMALRSNIVRGALIYKFDDNNAAPPAGMITKAPPIQVASWTGGYIGVFAGGHWSKDRWTSDETNPAQDLGAFDIKVNGGNFGGLIGANLQQGRAVWGIEADGGWMTGSGTFAGDRGVRAVFDTLEIEMHANAHGRLRFGYDAGTWMPFIAGGVAYANTRITIRDPENLSSSAVPVENRTLNRVGFTFGGGVDWKFAQNWIARAEYLYDRYGTASYGSAQQQDSEHFQMNSNIVRGALIYKY
jgi:opacity protein-like surface antigen